MNQRTHIHCLAGLAVSLAFAAGACGDSTSEREPAAAASAPSQPAAAPPDTANFERFLMQQGEEPGFRRIERAWTDRFDAFVKGNRMSKADAQELRSAGFISVTAQPIRGPRTYGISNVQVFATPEGAERWMARERRLDVIRSSAPEGAKIRRFAVPGVPGAHAVTVSKPGELNVGNVFWVQGRCLLVLGNDGPGSLAEPLSTGARAIYERTQDQCPCDGSVAEGELRVF